MTILSYPNLPHTPRDFGETQLHYKEHGYSERITMDKELGKLLRRVWVMAVLLKSGFFSRTAEYQGVLILGG
jgi:hypothetical protein